MRQVLVNLLSNAIKFTKSKVRASIEFGYLPDSGGGAYYVKDNGVGFDMQYVGKLFGVFQRLHAGYGVRGHGRGACPGTADCHAARGTGVGGGRGGPGSDLLLYPAERRGQVNDSEVEIVIVEDNPNDAELVTRVLKKHGLAEQEHPLEGWRRRRWTSCLRKEALPAGRVNGVPKVILLDLKLPKVDGIEVLRRLKSDERTRTIPVVALTSSTEQRDLKAAYELGVNSYVTKPIEFSKFAAIVAELGKYWLEVNRLPSR